MLISNILCIENMLLIDVELGLIMLNIVTVDKRKSQEGFFKKSIKFISILVTMT